LQFEKRDLILIAGIFLVIVGLIPFIAPIYATAIGIFLYFGIKIYMRRKKKMIQEEVGQGICMECGFKIIDRKCPNCENEL
jgi:phosphate/sulfate permease